MRYVPGLVVARLLGELTIKRKHKRRPMGALKKADFCITSIVCFLSVIVNNILRTAFFPGSLFQSGIHGQL
jgi:hypothetical protein